MTVYATEFTDKGPFEFGLVYDGIRNTVLCINILGSLSLRFGVGCTPKPHNDEGKE